jgi:hypothetical protein
VDVPPNGHERGQASRRVPMKDFNDALQAAGAQAEFVAEMGRALCRARICDP